MVRKLVNSQWCAVLRLGFILTFLGLTHLVARPVAVGMTGDQTNGFFDIAGVGLWVQLLSHVIAACLVVLSLVILAMIGLFVVGGASGLKDFVTGTKVLNRFESRHY